MAVTPPDIPLRPSACRDGASAIAVVVDSIKQVQDKMNYILQDLNLRKIATPLHSVYQITQTPHCVGMIRGIILGAASTVGLHFRATVLPDNMTHDTFWIELKELEGMLDTLHEFLDDSYKMHTHKEYNEIVEQMTRMARNDENFKRVASFEKDIIDLLEYIIKFNFDDKSKDRNIPAPKGRFESFKEGRRSGKDDSSGFDPIETLARRRNIANSIAQHNLLHISEAASHFFLTELNENAFEMALLPMSSIDETCKVLLKRFLHCYKNKGNELGFRNFAIYVNNIVLKKLFANFEGVFLAQKAELLQIEEAISQSAYCEEEFHSCCSAFEQDEMPEWTVTPMVSVCQNNDTVNQDEVEEIDSEQDISEVEQEINKIHDQIVQQENIEQVMAETRGKNVLPATIVVPSQETISSLAGSSVQDFGTIAMEDHKASIPAKVTYLEVDHDAVVRLLLEQGINHALEEYLVIKLLKDYTIAQSLGGSNTLGDVSANETFAGPNIKDAMVGNPGTSEPRVGMTPKPGSERLMINTTDLWNQLAFLENPIYTHFPQTMASIAIVKDACHRPGRVFVPPWAMQNCIQRAAEAGVIVVPKYFTVYDTVAQNDSGDPSAVKDEAETVSKKDLYLAYGDVYSLRELVEKPAKLNPNMRVVCSGEFKLPLDVVRGKVLVEIPLITLFQGTTSFSAGLHQYGKIPGGFRLTVKMSLTPLCGIGLMCAYIEEGFKDGATDLPILTLMKSPHKIWNPASENVVYLDFHTSSCTDSTYALYETTRAGKIVVMTASGWYSAPHSAVGGTWTLHYQPDVRQSVIYKPLALDRLSFSRHLATIKFAPNLHPQIYEFEFSPSKPFVGTTGLGMSIWENLLGLHQYWKADVYLEVVRTSSPMISGTFAMTVLPATRGYKFDNPLTQTLPRVEFSIPANSSRVVVHFPKHLFEPCASSERYNAIVSADTHYTHSIVIWALDGITSMKNDEYVVMINLIGLENLETQGFSAGYPLVSHRAERHRPGFWEVPKAVTGTLIVPPDDQVYDRTTSLLIAPSGISKKPLEPFSVPPPKVDPSKSREQSKVNPIVEPAPGEEQIAPGKEGVVPHRGRLHSSDETIAQNMDRDFIEHKFCEFVSNDKCADDIVFNITIPFPTVKTFGCTADNVVEHFSALTGILQTCAWVKGRIYFRVVWESINVPSSEFKGTVFVSGAGESQHSLPFFENAHSDKAGSITGFYDVVGPVDGFYDVSGTWVGQKHPAILSVQLSGAKHFSRVSVFLGIDKDFQVAGVGKCIWAKSIREIGSNVIFDMSIAQNGVLEAVDVLEPYSYTIVQCRKAFYAMRDLARSASNALFSRLARLRPQQDQDTSICQSYSMQGQGGAVGSGGKGAPKGARFGKQVMDVSLPVGVIVFWANFIPFTAISNVHAALPQIPPKLEANLKRENFPNSVLFSHSHVSYYTNFNRPQFVCHRIDGDNFITLIANPASADLCWAGRNVGNIEKSDMSLIIESTLEEINLV